MTAAPKTADLDRLAEAELKAAANADSADERKHHLDQAAMFAFESEESRRESSS